MPHEPQEQPKKTDMERHVQTILVSLITAAILWMALNSVKYQEQLARVEERMISMAEKIDDLIVLKTDVTDLKVRVKVLESKRSTQP
ncbi:MAG: hypothetical protein HUJ13_01585 [Hydrogenovibrio crunogenus]|nr:hypothetical protein [Hydrogenovibrio crunogenus]